MILPRNKNLGYTSAVISTVLLGSVGIFLRNIQVDELIITIARLGIGLIFLICYLLITGRFPKIDLKKFSFPLIATGLLLGLTMLFYMKAINITTLSNAVFLLYLGPIIATAITSLVFKETISKLNIFLLSIAFLGFTFLLEFKFNLSGSMGNVLGFAAGLCYASYIVINRRISTHVDSMERSFYQFLFGLIILLPFIFTVNNISFSLKDIIWLTGISFFQGFLAITFIIIAIKNLKAIEYGTISYVEPLVASLIGYMLYSEQLTFLQFIGCVIIFISGLTQVVTSKKNI